MKLMFISNIRAMNWRRHYYQLKHRFMTTNNIVLAVALLVAFGWAWGSVSMMQRNYSLQRKLDTKERELTLNQLEVATLEYERNYHQSTEYQELAARIYLGLANPGEKVLILPPNSEEATKAGDSTTASVAATAGAEPSNLSQWIDFLSGKNARALK